MRTLVEQADPAGLLLLDGVKTIDADGWTLVLPDPETPVTRVHAEGRTRAEAEQRAERAAKDIEWILAEGNGLTGRRSAPRTGPAGRDRGHGVRRVTTIAAALEYCRRPEGAVRNGHPTGPEIHR